LLLASSLACRSGEKTAGTSAPEAPPPPVTAPTEPARPQLPPDPPPSFAQGAAEVPGLEAKLAANKTYFGLWSTLKPDDRTLLLTGVSELVIAGGFSGPLRTMIEGKPDTKDAAIKLFLVFVRVGHFPDAFTSGLRAHLEAVKDEPHHGLWSAYQKGKVPHDFAALGAWLMRDRADYYREVLSAKVLGPQSWASPEEPPPIPYLGSQLATLQRLGLLAELTPDESAKLAELKADAAVLKVGLTKLLSEYHDNEVRADGQFKGKVIRTAGTVGDVKKDILGAIYVTVGTGKMFEIPVVQCFVRKGEEQRAAALSKGDNVTVRGRVGGLLMNVLVKDCEIVP
jgi:hypothetical protein